MKWDKYKVLVWLLCMWLWKAFLIFTWFLSTLASLKRVKFYGMPLNQEYVIINPSITLVTAFLSFLFIFKVWLIHLLLNLANVTGSWLTTDENWVIKKVSLYDCCIEPLILWHCDIFCIDTAHNLRHSFNTSEVILTIIIVKCLVTRTTFSRKIERQIRSLD